MQKIKQRKWFVIGLFSCLLLLVFLNQFIWKIEVSGLNTVSAKQITDRLAAHGLKIGAFRPFIDEKKLQNEILIETPELSWLWVDKKGSKVIVEVKERVMPPTIYDKDTLCDLVAHSDGIIESMVIRHGNPTVSLGDTVRKGDILVTGLLTSEKGVTPRYVQSDGEIYARVWYEKTKAFSVWTPKETETGKKEVKRTLHIFGKAFSLFKNAQSGFDEFSTEESEWELSLFGRYLGISFSTITYKEISTSYEKHSHESTAQAGILELSAEIDAEASPNGKQIEIRSEYTVLDDDTVEVTVIAEYLEDIAEKRYPKNQTQASESP